MSSLLTFEEYQAIADGLAYPTGAFIDGRFQVAGSGETFDTVNPANGNVLTRVAACGRVEVDHAVLKARESFEDRRWAGLHPSDRKAVLIKLCKLMKRNQRELAVLESLESGKPIAEVETIDISACHEMQWMASGISMVSTSAIGFPLSKLSNTANSR